jgi:hypothetical protein
MKRTARKAFSVYASTADAGASTSTAAGSPAPASANSSSDSALLRVIASQMTAFAEGINAANQACEDTRLMLTEQLEIQTALIESNRAAASAEVKAAAQNIQTQYKAASTTFIWKGKGNEAQHIWNCELLNTVLEAAACISSDDLAGPKQYVEKGMREILFRNKLIKLADGSPVGWGLVEEYLKNSLAEDDSDD